MSPCFEEKRTKEFYLRNHPEREKKKEENCWGGGKGASPQGDSFSLPPMKRLIGNA